MRKYVIGALVGAALMFGIQAGATAVLTGSKVAGTKEVTLGGQAIGQAAIINNTSYLPVRALSDALGLQIDLAGGKIDLTTPTTPQPTPSSGPAATPVPTDNQYTAAEIDFAITEKESRIKLYSELSKKYADEGNKESAKSYADMAEQQKAELAIWQQRKAELQSQSNMAPQVIDVIFTG